MLQLLDKQEMKSDNSKSATLQKIAYCVKGCWSLLCLLCLSLSYHCIDADNEGYVYITFIVLNECSGNVNC